MVMTHIEAQPNVTSWPGDVGVEPAAPARTPFATFVLGTLIWSLGSAFSHYWSFDDYGGGETTGQAVSSIALGLAIVFIGIGTRLSLYAWVQTLTGWMIALHGFAALMSAIVNEAHPLAAVRYLLLIPGISIMIAAVTLGGVIFCVYQFSMIDFGSILNPYYRLFTFLNPNGVGFISAMTGISLLDYALNRFFLHRKRLGPGTAALFLLVAVCLVLCVATKSRTATLVMVAGCLLRVLLLLGPTRMMLLATVLSVLAVTVAWDNVAAAGDKVAEVFQLNDRYRAVNKATGRFNIWSTVVTEIWMPDPWLGVGPARHLVMTQYLANASSAHNGLLAVLADTGILGTLPLVIILAVCARRAFARRREAQFVFAIPLFLGGLIESMAETMFFSLGNPGSLFFLLAVAVLSVRAPRPAEPQFAAYDASDDWQGMYNPPDTPGATR
jgi:O-antigen ligase